MALTYTKLKNAKPADKPYKLADGEGMFALIHPNGSKYWRLKYRVAGKEKLLALGSFPDVSIDEARDKRREARKLLADGVDPSQHKQERRRVEKLNASNSFEAIAREWHETNKAKWTEQHGARILRRLEANIFPALGKRPIAEIKPAEILEAIRKVEARGATELSHRILQNCGMVFRYAIATSRAEYNPASDLKGALQAHSATNYPTI